VVVVRALVVLDRPADAVVLAFSSARAFLKSETSESST
jgi:hypothetical protein